MADKHNSTPDSENVKLTPEEWRDVPGYEGHYQVSDQGRVKSCPRTGSKGGALSPHIGNGYLRVNLRKAGGRKTYLIHYLVMVAFVGERPRECEIDHINGNRLDNRLANLRYLHHTENHAQGARTRNKNQRGEKNPYSVLTDQQRHEMRNLYATGDYTMAELGRMFAVSSPVVRYNVKLSQDATVAESEGK